MTLFFLLTACRDDPKPPVNVVPDVQITSHQDGDTVTAGEQITLTAAASDAEDGLKKLYIGWFADGQSLCPFTLVDPSGENVCETALQVGATGVTAIAQDADGGQGVSTVSLNVQQPTAPTVEITAPSPSQRFYSDVAIDFEGLIEDTIAENEDIEVQWVSDLDGEFTTENVPSESGLTIASAQLSEGIHEIILTAENPFGLVGQDSLNIDVGGENRLPVCSIIKPEPTEIISAGIEYQVWGNAVDPDIPEMELSFVWTSSIDGELSTEGADVSGNSAFYASLSPGLHTLTMSATDEVGGSCAASVEVEVNAPPEVVINTPQDGDRINEGETVELQVTVSDFEDTTSTIPVNVTSSVDGTLGAVTLDEQGQGSLSLSLSPGNHTLTVLATDSVGQTGEQSISIFANALPSSPIVLLSPNPAYTDDELVVSAYGSTDGDGDTVSYLYSWYKDGLLQPQTGSRILATDTLKGEAWRVVVTPNDGSSDGLPNEASLTIQNSTPVVTAVSIAPNMNVMSSDTLTCTASASDADEVPVITYSWLNNGTPFASGDVVDLGAYTVLPTSTVTCEVMATDSDGLSAISSTSVTISNSDPVIDSIVIDPQPITADALASCSATASDSDGDSPSLSYSWMRNGMGIGVGSTFQLSANNFAVGDTLSCMVTAVDAFNAVVTDSFDVTVDNTPPEISSVSVSPTEIYADTLMNCSVSASDLNDGTPLLSFEWFNNDTGMVLGTQPSLLLSPADVYPGQSLSCTVTASDLNGASVVENASVVVSNTPPEFSVSPLLSPSSGHQVDQSIECSAQASDLDGDPVSMSYSWTVDGQPAGTGSAFLPTESNTDVGQNISCTVDAVDSLGGTTSLVVSTVLDNTLPEISAVNITPNTGVNTASALSCAAVVADADADPLTESFIWKNASTGATLGTGDSYQLQPQDGSPGQMIECAVEVNDPNGGVATLSGSVQIENTLPTVDSVSILPSTDVRSDSELTCSATGSDADNESIVLTYEWVNDTTGQSIGSGDSIVLNAGLSTPGQTVSCVATATDDSGGMSSGSIGVLVNNTEPVINDVMIAPDTAVTTSTTLACDVDALDVDGGTPTAAFTWRNDTTGSDLGTSNTFTLTPQNSSPDDVIRCEATVVDVDGGSSSGSNTVTVINSPPIVTDVAISPASGIFADSQLSCSASASDPDDTGYTFEFSWVNATSGLTFGTGSSVTLNPGWVYMGDVIECTVTAIDTNGGEGSATASATVENTPPTIDSIVLSPSSDVTTSSSVSCSASASDLDGDVPQVSYAWRNENTNIQLSNSASLTLTPSIVSPGDVISCVVTATDSGSAVGTASDSLTVVNTDPVVDSVSINPNTGISTLSTMECVGTASDADGGTPSLSYEWFNANTGASIGSGSLITLDPNAIQPDEQVQCAVIAADLDGGEGLDVASVLVENTPPLVESVSIAPAVNLTTSSSLTCSALVSDVDIDTPSLSYLWTNMTTGIELGVGDGLTLDSSMASPNDLIQCMVTATDSFGGTHELGETVGVDNSVPIISSVQIDPETGATTSTTLVCSGTVDDPDGGVPSENIMWTNLTTGQILGSGDSLVLSPAESAPGDSVQCTLTASDADGGSASDTAVVIIENSDPVITGVSISPDPVYNDSLATCVVSVSDPDEQTMTESYTWTNTSTGASLGTGASIDLDDTMIAPGQALRCSVLVEDSSGGTASSSTIVLVPSRAPVVDSMAISPDSGITTSAALTCEATASDPDGQPTSLSYTWFNGSNVLGSGMSLSLDSSIAQPGDSITCEATASDTSGMQGIDSVSVSVDNSAPIVSNVTVLPAAPYVTSNLYCSVSYSDPDGQSMTVSYQWRNVTQGTSLGTSAFQALDTTVAAPSDVIECSATVTDAGGESSTGSGTVGIVNRAPVLGTVTISPSTNITVASSLSCSSSATDPDGETPSISYVWVNDGVTIGNGSSIALNANIAQPGDDIFCVATAMDASGASDSNNALVSISNTGPVVDSVSITPDPAYNDNTLSCIVVASDADGQSLTTTYLWKNLNTGASLGSASSLTLSSASTSTNDIIQCIATVKDPADATDSDTAERSISNRSPVMSSVGISPSTGVTTSTTLICTGQGSDIDDDTVSYSYVWTNGSNVLGTGATLTLSPSTAQPSDTVTCTSTVTDSNGATDVGTTTVAVDNTEPVIGSVSIAPEPSYNDSTLSCVVVSSDADGQSLSTSYVWTNVTQGASLGTSQTLTLSSASASSTDTIRCEATVTDPSGGSVTSALDRPMTNRAPVVTGVTIAPNSSVTTSTALSCSATGSDIDTDSTSFGFVWTNGSNVLGTGSNISLTPSIAQPGDSITCTATITDSNGATDSDSTAVTVDNIDPVISSVGITPNTAYNDSTLTCTVVSSDADAQTLTTSYVWTNVTQNSTLGTAQTLTLSSAAASSTDTVRCTATVTDPSGGSDTSNAVIGLSNRAPAISAVGISPDPAYNNSTLSCNVNASDADVDTLSTGYVWTNVTQNTTLGTAQTLSLSASSASSTDTIRCTATVTDSTGSSDTSAADRSMSNRPPVINSVTVSPSSNVTTSSTLTCAGAGSDIDGDSTSLSYEWTNGSSVLGSSTTLVLTPSIAQPGDDITCTVAITDSNGAWVSVAESVGVINTDPVISSVSITPDPAYNDSTLTCSVVSSDADSQTLSTSYLWINTTQNVLLGSTQTLTLSSAIANSTDDVFCQVTVTDSSGGTVSDGLTRGLTNRAPTMTSVAITPASNVTTSSSLTCAGQGTDIDGDSVSTSYVWTNGSNVLGTAATLTLSPSLAQPGDSITCTSTITDSNGATDSDATSVTTVNTDPVIATVSVSPSTAYNDSTLTCSVSATDADGQSLSTSYVWMNGSSQLGTGQTLVLSSATASVGNSISCTATVTDSSGGTDIASGSKTLSNRVPVLSSVAISPSSTPVTGSVLSCSGSASDPDGQSVSLSYAWTNGTTAIASGSSLTVTTSNASPGDTLTCTVTATDTSSGSVSDSVSVSMGNTNPVISAISVSPSTIYNDSTLTCTVVASDADGQALTTSYIWTNGTTQIGTSQSLTLSSTLASVGDSITCSATVTDSSGGTDVSGVSKTVSNRNPSVNSVSVSPSTAYNDSTLTCNASASDADGQALTTSYVWTNGTTQLGTSQTLILSVMTASVGDSITCSATVTDGSGGSDVSAASVSLSNRAPTVSSVTISPSVNVSTSDTVTCSATGSDPDGQSVSLSYVWRLNGSQVATGASLSIGSTSAIGGDVLTCQATASDGSLSGSDTASVTLSGGGVYTGLVLNGTTDTLTSGTYTYQDVVLTNGATLYIDGDVTLIVDTLIVDGTSLIDGSGSANNGGALSSNSSATGGGLGSSNSGSGGGGYGGAGGKGGHDASDTVATGGSTHGDSTSEAISMGGGAGGISCLTGSAGGGALTVYVNVTASVSGEINMDGASGSQCSDGRATGGGAGGGIMFVSNAQKAALTVTGTLSADGGNGGVCSSSSCDGGGGGGGGRIKVLDFFIPKEAVTGTLSVSGGSGGPYGDTSYGLNGGTGTTYIEEVPVQCSDIQTTMSVWGASSSSGVDLRAFTDSTLHWMGCTGDGCAASSFYCNSDTSAETLEFGANDTMRMVVDPNNILGDTMSPSTSGGCCSSSNPHGICNAFDSNNNGYAGNPAEDLCWALGYTSGSILAEANNNYCPEGHSESSDGTVWSSDYSGSNGYGRVYKCTGYR